MLLQMMRHGARLDRLRCTPVGLLRPRTQQNFLLQYRAFTATRVAAQGGMAHLFSRPLLDFVLIISRIARITFGTALAVTTVAIGIWEGTHQYVEHVAMRSAGALAVSDDEFGWASQTALDLLGKSGSGSDARLGSFGRHLVRSAWIAENWGGGVTPTALFGSAMDDQHVSNHGLVLAEKFLASALSVAESRMLTVPESIDINSGTILDPTAVQLEVWHAAICERLATPSALSRAASEYEKLYDAVTKAGYWSQSAVFATRLGAVHSLLGHLDESDKWMQRAVAINTEGTSITHVLEGGATKSISPLDSRSLISTLVAYSRIHALTSASRKDLHNALNTAVNTARLAHTQSAITGGDSAKLHSLWMLQQEAHLSVFIGEIIYALQRTKPSLMEYFSWSKHIATPEAIGGQSSHASGSMSTVEWLEHAQKTAENVVTALGDMSAYTGSMSIPARDLVTRANSVSEEAKHLLTILS